MKRSGLLLSSGGVCSGWHRNACEGWGPRVTRDREAEGHTEHHPRPRLDEIDLTHKRLLIVNDRSSAQPGLSEKRDFRVLKARTGARALSSFSRWFLSHGQGRRFPWTWNFRVTWSQLSSPSTMTTFSPCLYMLLSLRKTLIGFA